VVEQERARDSERPLVNIVGALVALGPLRRDLLPSYQAWINHFGTVRNLTTPRPMTSEQEASWYEQAANTSTSAPFTIYERATWRAVGNTALHDIDHRNRTAEFGIVIGEEDCRGKGYGTEATRLVLDYAFTALGLHSVLLRVHEYNLAGQRAYHKAGFREIGRRRQSYWMGGRLWDVIYMDCLASDFVSPVLRPIFTPDAPSSR
jgi:RimJ/RimL family protein N-acetyltransferase